MDNKIYRINLGIMITFSVFFYGYLMYKYNNRIPIPCTIVTSCIYDTLDVNKRGHLCSIEWWGLNV